MPYDVRFIPETPFALASVSGPFTTAEICGLFSALLAERGQLGGMRIFCDVSAADSTAVSTKVIWPAVDFLRQRQDLFAGMRWANFAAASLLNFAISRMAGQMSNDLPFEYQAFISRERALNWLAMPPALRKAHIPECAVALR